MKECRRVWCIFVRVSGKAAVLDTRIEEGKKNAPNEKKKKRKKTKYTRDVQIVRTKLRMSGACKIHCASAKGAALLFSFMYAVLRPSKRFLLGHCKN